MKFIPAMTMAALGLLAGACGTDSPGNTAATPPKAARNSGKVANGLAATDACTTRLREFLRWYLATTDYENPDPNRLGFTFKIPVNAQTDSAVAASIAPDQVSPTNYMQVDWPSVDNYLATLEKSGYFSRSYLQEKRASIERRGKAFDASHLEDGEPEGFEADEIFWMMELYAPADIALLSAYRSAQLKPGAVAYRLPAEGDPNFQFLLYTKKEQGRCVIDSVAHLRDGRPESIRRQVL
ncbi:hypothetical protein LGH70_14910 [Hymenobacter sp. BT635]|uniref:Lipoprotein n=1 Tax=Hymenobacter nitidus TaxID=2880929 RepID=A0ABS8AI40_9BACT|nr:hypothetical protein [Hymenobacter nitidus]MCB2378890.1 hypothetical protein [Hymenobacter nitidus]